MDKAIFERHGFIMKTKLLVENWRRFLNESSSDKKFSIGLVPMSAKPFHEGHMTLIRKAAEECKDVIVYVSTSDRKKKGEHPILGSDMKSIWDNILEGILPANVSCEYGGSPVRNVYVKLEEGLQEENLDKHYAVYTGEEDAGRYNEKYFKDMVDRVSIETMSRGEDTMAISGTLMRQHIADDNIDEFKAGLPSELNDSQKDEIFNTLKGS